MSISEDDVKKCQEQAGDSGDKGGDKGGGDKSGAKDSGK